MDQDKDLETLKGIAARVGDQSDFALQQHEMPFFHSIPGREWLTQVGSGTSPRFQFSDHGKQQLMNARKSETS